MKVAGIQAAPVFLDTQATLEKALSLMSEAANNGAELCVFPETFLSGYPVWLELPEGGCFNDADQKAAYAAYVECSVRVEGPELQRIAEAAAILGIFVYLGIVERATSEHSVYCSLAAIHPERGIVGVHRKLMPTHNERLVWSLGDGHGLRAYDWKSLRVGGLNCWENWMPLARHAMYSQGEDLHVATWPGAPYLTRDISRFIAMEGRVYVLSVGGVLTINDVPESFPLKAQLAQQSERFLSGGTMLVAPDGEVLQGPMKNDENILYGDVDIARVRAERQTFDPTGHYSRPDVFDVRIDRRRRRPFEDEALDE